tara:strand:- start:61 stop:396 length:336 start_codon:yes stop_codon:yes gene_type:complete
MPLKPIIPNKHHPKINSRSIIDGLLEVFLIALVTSEASEARLLSWQNPHIGHIPFTQDLATLLLVQLWHGRLRSAQSLQVSLDRIKDGCLSVAHMAHLTDISTITKTPLVD